MSYPSLNKHHDCGLFDVIGCCQALAKQVAKQDKSPRIYCVTPCVYLCGNTLSELITINSLEGLQDKGSAIDVVLQNELHNDGCESAVYILDLQWKAYRGYKKHGFTITRPPLPPEKRSVKLSGDENILVEEKSQGLFFFADKDRITPDSPQRVCASKDILQYLLTITMGEKPEIPMDVIINEKHDKLFVTNEYPFEEMIEHWPGEVEGDVKQCLTQQISASTGWIWEKRQVIIASMQINF